ncbi:MAG: TVP38/TMEM64 family protein [Trueperaceae bacterium]|nr:TVP38/TMEM64 family protein [Trueperaceae bacterium]
MTEALSHFINDAGLFAPLYYVLSFVVTALLPFIPTPLVGALGGAAFGVVPAILYGIVGMGLGAFVALNLSRRIGRPIILKLVTPKVWAEWESLLGIRSVFVWGVIFFILNVDFAVVAAGLSGVPLVPLWIAAMVARLPWLVASAWFGDLVFVSDTVMLLALVVMLGMIVVLAKLRPLVHRQLVRWADRSDGRAAAAERGEDTARRGSRHDREERRVEERRAGRPSFEPTAAPEATPAREVPAASPGDAPSNAATPAPERPPRHRSRGGV